MSYRFETFGQQLQAVARHAVTRQADRRLVEAAAGLNESTPSEGGFVVQTNFVDALLQKMYNSGEILGRCTRLPEPSGNKVFAPVVNESSRADGSRFGGARGYWIREADAITASTPSFGGEEMLLHKVGAVVYVSDDLLEDVSQLESYVESVALPELLFKIERAVIQGTGAGQPLGILNAACNISVAKATSQTAATVWGDNILAMWQRCFGPCRRSAVWLYNEDADPFLLALAAEADYASGSATQFGLRLFNPDGNSHSGGYPTLLGRPCVPCEHCSTLGTEGDVVLADFSQYVYADKLAKSISTHVQFAEAESVFRFTWRINGQPLWSSALTPTNSTTTKSPFVSLAARG